MENFNDTRLDSLQKELTQMVMVDYHDMFVPIAKFINMRTLLEVVIKKN